MWMEEIQSKQTIIELQFTLSIYFLLVLFSVHAKQSELTFLVHDFFFPAAFGMSEVK